MQYILTAYFPPKNPQLEKKIVSLIMVWGLYIWIGSIINLIKASIFVSQEG